MIRKILLACIALIFALPAVPAAAKAPKPPVGDWGYLRPGIDWQKFHLTSPREVNIFVARLHRGELSATIDTGISQGSILTGKETTSGMAARYQDAINFWGYTEPVSSTWVQAWGSRNDVAVAINGYFFDQDNGRPWSGVIHSGWYAHRFTNNVGDAGFGWTHERQAFIGACVYHVAGKNDVTFPAAATDALAYDPNIAAINVPRSDEELILYTPQYDANTGTQSVQGDPVLEILVELTEPAQVLPKPAYASGVIRKIDKQANGTPIPFDHVVLSFWGDVRAAAISRIDSDLIKVGDEVRISQEIANCVNSKTKPEWTKTYSSLGGDYHFLLNGVYDPPGNPDANVANSRTAVAYNDQYVYFVVVDAFDCQAPEISRGLSILELNNFLEGTLGATNAVTLDSGGSSTMVVNGNVVNNTTCNFTRDCGCTAEQGGVPPNQTVLDPALTYKIDWDNPTGMMEPMVGTSMMMISVAPFTHTNTFTPTQAVTTTAGVSLRLGPGYNYSILGGVPSGTHGEVISTLSGVNGVQATGAYWWRVDLGDLAGWVEEHNLEGGTSPNPPPVYTSILFMPAISRANVVTAAATPMPTPYRSEQQR